MGQNVFSSDAWTRAKNRFVEDLTDEEQRIFVQASPETILYDASAAEKIHQAKSTTRGFVTKLQPFVEAVEQYGTALDVYSNIHPLVMGPLWGSLTRESGKYFEKIAEMFNSISDLLPRLHIYEQLFPTHENLVQALSVVYFDILKFCSDAKAMFRRSKRLMMTLVWKPFKRQFGSQMDAFRKHQKQIEKDVSLSHMIEAADSRAMIRSNQLILVKDRYDEERLDTFKSLSPVDYEAKHRKLRGLRHEGTGTWVVQHTSYIEWKEGTISKGLVCHGIPGSGKSVLTSLIVDDHLEKTNSPTKNALYFYCDYADPLALQPVHMYRALLQQLFFRGLMTEAIVKSIIETLRSNVHGLDEQKLTDLICAAIQSCAGLHVIIDGLDECERDAQKAVTKLLCRLLTIGHPVVKVLITCRDEGHLLTGLSDFGRLHISSQASAADIESYISHAVASSISSGDLTLRNRALKEEIISKLVEKAQGMFLWVHFQIVDLCDAASDEDILQILEHLPEGLYDTFTRIFMKIAKCASKATVLKAMMWMVCARRPLRVEELQEALAFDSNDKSWNVDKIPDGAKIIRSCHGLVIRDAVSETVRLAHHTVQQYLVSPPGHEEVTLGAHWPELSKFRRNSDPAEVMAGSFCVTYLCFSDFETAVSCINDYKKFNLATAFKNRGPISIPAALGLGTNLDSLTYKFFGSQNSFKMPDIDYSKYLNVTPRDRRPSPDFKSKFAMLEYVIEYWPWHINCLQWSTKSKSLLQFWDLVQHKSLPFEFRPWGPNQHFGPNGCKGCPAPDSNDLEPKDLPSMGLVHWAAETGHLRAFDRIEPPLHEYLKHERHHDETLLIACRHRQDSVVKLLLDCQTFNFSDGRAIVTACTSGSMSILYRLLQAQDPMSALPHKPGSLSTFISGNFGPVALYQAASNGHQNIVGILLAKNADAYVSDVTTGLTCLQIAAKNGHLEVVRELCTSLPLLETPRGRKMDAPHESTGMKALHYAAVTGHHEIVTFLLEHGLDCDDRNLLGETALIKASQNGQVVVARVLLGGGADPRVRGGEIAEGRRTPSPLAIHHAASNGHDNVIAVLPYSDLTCGNYETNALHLGAIYGHSNVVQALLSKGAEIESEDSRRMTALHFASQNGHKQVVQLLLDRGCSIERGRRNGETALHIAARAAKIETIKLLVSRGAAITAKTSNGDTALHLAARYADVDTIRALVELGAPLEGKNNYGATVLDIAVSRKLQGNVRAIIELGADWTCDAQFLLALKSNDYDVLNILLKRLSTATAKERNCAAGTIEDLLKEPRVVSNRYALRILWERSKGAEIWDVYLTP